MKYNSSNGFFQWITPVFASLTLLSCQSTPDLPDPLEAGWKGEKVCEVIFESDDQRILRCTFPPGVGHEKHYHLPHVGYTITGSTFRIEDEEGVREVEVPDNSTFHNDELSTHMVENVGDRTAVFLIIENR